jgi:hypothetical protein
MRESANAVGVYMLYFKQIRRQQHDPIELAFSEIEKLPPADQNKFAAWILEELHSDQCWEKLFVESGDLLSSLADEALAEHKAQSKKLKTLL